ncbi:MAG TPA: FAD/NAD(P)-binding oxidoreductase [Roseomonas sp.]|nr:FAD/NAD(P)-binding oxidoreductase [Roseomonas sp.]
MAEAPVIVVGAGPAGIRAAERLIAAGLRPILVEEGERNGGQIYRRQPEGFTRPASALYGSEAAKATALHTAADALVARLDYRPGTLAWAVEGGALLTQCGDRVRRLPYAALILCAGATDRVMPVPGWTLPGVYSLGGAQVALKAQACAIGRRCVFLGTGPLLYLVAWQYAKAGAEVAAVLDTSPAHRRLAALPRLAARPAVLAQGMRYIAWLRRRGIPLRSGVRPLRIEGEDRVSAVVVEQGGREQRYAADAVGIGYGLRSETQLADLAKVNFAFDPVSRQWLPALDEDGRSSVPGIYLAGDGAMIRGADAAELAGRLAACAALRDLGQPVPESEIAELRRALRPMSRFRRGLETGFPWPAQQAAVLPDETVICRCETITAGDLRRSVTEGGAPEVNRAKSFSRVGMGRCQGRICGLAAAEVVAAARGVPLEEVGRLRGAAPVKPLPLTLEIEA